MSAWRLAEDLGVDVLRAFGYVAECHAALAFVLQVQFALAVRTALAGTALAAV